MPLAVCSNKRGSDYPMNLRGKAKVGSLMNVAEAVEHVHPQSSRLIFAVYLSDDVRRQVRGQGEARLEFFGVVLRATQSL